MADLLCDIDEDDKKWEQTIKEARGEKIKEKLVDLNIIIEIEVERGIGLVAGTTEGETAEIGNWIGM